MSEDTNVEIVTPPVAAEPVVEASEVRTESEDSFVDEMVGEVPNIEETKEAEEEIVPESKTPEPVAEPREEASPAEPAEIPVEVPKKAEEPQRISRMDRRLAQKYRENLVLKGEESPSDEAIEAELRGMNIDEKKIALRNIIGEIGSLRGQRVDTLAPEDEEAMIEAEVEKRMAVQQREVFEREFQDDLVKTLTNHPLLDNRTASYNPKIEAAVNQIVQSGVLPSEAFKIVNDAIETSREESRKNTEIDKQRSMSGAVLAPSNQDVITKEPETDEERFLRDALG